MSELSTPPTAVGPRAATDQSIQGKLGIGGILFSIAAWAAPLLVVVGLMPSMIKFAGEGIIAALLATTVILLVFSAGYNAMTRHVDRPGAFYAYITAGLGKRAGLGGAFVAVFTYSILPLSTWAAFGIFAREFFVGALGMIDLPWFVFSFAGALVVGACGYLHVELSAKVLGVSLILEVLLVLVFNLRVLFDGGPAGAPVEAFSWDSLAGGGFGLALVFAMLCFGGFESSAIYREEVKDPNKTVPRATYVAVISIGAFYLLAAWFMLQALGPAGVDHLQSTGDDISTTFSDLAGAYLGAVVPGIINGLVILSTFATLLAQHNAVARYLYSFGRDGVIATVFGAAHPKHRSPYRASMTFSIVSLVAILVMAALTGFDAAGEGAFVLYVTINGIGAVGIVALLTLVSLAVFMYFRRHPGLSTRSGSWRTIYAPLVSLIAIAAIFVLGLLNLDLLVGAGATASALLSLLIPAVFAVGLAYATVLRRRKPDVFERIGRQ